MRQPFGINIHNGCRARVTAKDLQGNPVAAGRPARCRRKRPAGAYDQKMSDSDGEPSALPGDRYEDLVRSLTELVRTLTEDESVPETMQSILALLLRSVPGCDAASITVFDDRGQPGTSAATDEATYKLDSRQYALADGPCLDAARCKKVNRWDLREVEQRWPEFADLAKKMGLHSYLSAGLDIAGRPVGAMNLASHDPDGFGQLDEELVALFTAPAAAAIAVAGRYSGARNLAAQFEQALGSRAVIDQAIGIIMAESRCDASQAFATLTRASNNRNMKLRDLAAEIVARVGGRPSSGSAG
jgi:transcriptional regulator with GAF, ATPase, and Fis domain